MFHKVKKNRIIQIIFLTLTGFLLGVLIIWQSKYFTNFISLEGRDSDENIFRKIQILKTSNDELSEEIKVLEKQLEELSDQTKALESIKKEIKKNKIIAGEVDIFGPGIKLEINNELSEIWLTDITNELFASGAEAISVNNIRLVNSTIGFDTLPNGQIMLNSVILNPPYTFAAIGDKSALLESLEAPRGILNRMELVIENFHYSLEEKDRIEMEKV
jgi:uncharacterized protein YlxW (UPF0749 family)